ncbi:MAG: YchF/TatD family DNA exonuclease [Flavobacteriales bacterium]|nr:YchF/TatD family DNA exonuclease [Flavobacteriales bacterium]
MVDTHTHLYSSQFDDDIESVIGRAVEHGVERMLLPNIDRSSTEALWNVVNAYPERCFPMMGLHPCSVNETYKAELAHVEKELATGRYIAVGEIGIDLYWDKTYIKEQVTAFEQQMEWAKELELPVAIHCRESFDEIFASVEKVQDGRLRGVLHCFTGTEEQARKCIDLGLHLGLGGVLTFKKSGIDAAIKHIPMEWLVLETDSPYLAPTPYRGKRNESAYTKLVAEKLAEVKEMTLDEVAAITTKNAEQLFNL